MSVKNKSEKSVIARKSGHYWVKWSGIAHMTPAVWRMGAFFHGTQTWSLTGTDRVFYDSDFLEINENRIPFTTGAMLPVFWVWVAGAAYVTGSVVYIILILKGVTK